MHRQRRHQVIKPENKGDLRRPVIRQFIPGEGGDILPVDKDIALRRAVQSAQEGQKRALPRAGQAEDDDKFPLLQAVVDMVQRPQRMRPALVDPAHIAQFHNCHTETPFSSG